MTYLRHSTRHVHQTVIDYLTSRLDALGWTDPSDVPFGAPAVVIIDEFPPNWDEASVLEPGMMVITVGAEDSAKEQELGGPLAMIEIPIFIDCFMDTDGVALALACDVRDILCGRQTLTSPYHVVTDYSQSPAADADGYSIEFDDVIRQRIKSKWHVVKASALMYFPDGRES